MRIVILMCAVLAVCHAAGSQPNTEPKHTIGAGLGYHSYVFIDHHASPLRYDNAGDLYFLKYVRNTDRGRHRLLFSYDRGRYSTAGAEADRMFEEYTRLRFQGGYTHRFLSFLDNDVNLLGGFMFDNTYTHRNHFYLPERSELFVRYMVTFHPVVEIDYRLGDRDRIRSGIHFSATGLIVHSPYAIRGSKQYSFQFFNSYGQMGWLVSYRRLLSYRVEMEIVYSFDYIRYSAPQEYRGAGDQIKILVGYGF